MLGIEGKAVRTVRGKIVNEESKKEGHYGITGFYGKGTRAN